MGAFGKSQHMQATTDHPQGDKADLSVIEAIVLALECRVPIKSFRSLQGHAVLGDITSLLVGSNSISIVISYTHKIGDTIYCAPINWA